VLQKYLSDNSAVVIDGMKPLIREWMDEHFPPLLEGAVRAEVERVVRSRGAKR
jgi:cell pole-organizing protein PopZ